MKKKKVTLEDIQKRYKFKQPLNFYKMGISGKPEEKEQKAFFTCLRAEFPEELGCYELDGQEDFPLAIVAVADFYDAQSKKGSSGRRFSTKMSKYQKMGYQRHTPDMIFMIPRGQYHGLVIEMKSTVGRASPGQKKTLTMLKQQCYSCHVCLGFAEALDVWLKYINLI